MLKILFFVAVTALVIIIVQYHNNYVTTPHSNALVQEVKMEINDAPSDGDIVSVIKIISEAVENGDISTLENYVIAAPESYKEKYLESLGRELNIDKKTLKEQMTPKPGTFSKAFFPSFPTKKRQVRFAIFYLEKISKGKRKFVKIRSIKENGDEAKAQVVFGHEGLRDEIYEILLYRVNGEWKFFMFDYENRYSDLYAEPEEAGVFL
jgi:hypothetical protein